MLCKNLLSVIFFLLFYLTYLLSNIHIYIPMTKQTLQMLTVPENEAQEMMKPLADKTIAIIWCGSQWHAHALNLQDSWLNVVVWLRKESSTRDRAEKAGLKVMETAEAAQAGDIIMMLVPDTKQPKIYKDSIAPHLTAGKSLVFSHWFNIHYGTITPPADVDVWMIAPKWPGHIVRQTYTQDFWVPCLLALHQDATGSAKKLAIAYATWIGWARAGVIETSFKEETETDLFGEQTILCGWTVQLIQKWFETLIEAGYKPEVAYFECLHELKLIVDLIHVWWIAAMNYSISNTAEWGEYVSGNRIIDDGVKDRMKQVLAEIQDGSFAKRWIEENENGCPVFEQYRKDMNVHAIEEVWEQLRDMMKIKDRLQWWWTKQFLAEEQVKGK